VRRPLLVLVPLLLTVGCGHAPWSSSRSATPGVATVVRVVDGDTVVLQLGSATETARLIGIDTPETVKPDTPVQCFGPEASAHLKSLLPAGTGVRVARDQEARDHFGRLLAYVWRRADAQFVNLDMVAGGFARPLSIAPNVAHQHEMAAAAAEARSAGRGLWSRCEGDDARAPP